ncbi:hypothetical protein [Sphingomonas paeninsulae]|uniref:hypothetical protein n=1 Tax=Sphingomonas paeninsulae TaxID=2319844 RepID=UPI0013CF0915|nr:hypothetical protein [Sphingomonas paeninsulae]
MRREQTLVASSLAEGLAACRIVYRGSLATVDSGSAAKYLASRIARLRKKKEAGLVFLLMRKDD